MKLQTPVQDEKCKVGISYEDKIMMLGSCFSDNIGRVLADYGFDVCVNPFGTLYNPASIGNSIRRLISGEHFCEAECIQMGAGSEKICSFSHHTSFARNSVEEFLANANEELAKASAFFKDCNKLIITLGTAWCYRHKGTASHSDLSTTHYSSEGQIVSNCLKRNPKEFERVRLGVDECFFHIQSALNLVNSPESASRGIKPKEVIFTVSPIRHFSDGAHGNQLSKSTLLLAVDRFTSADIVSPADYFPAYEIVMDELRDYRFYAEDMCHPSAQSVGYLAERFFGWALPASEAARLAASIRSHKQSQHRPH